MSAQTDSFKNPAAAGTNGNPLLNDILNVTFCTHSRWSLSPTSTRIPSCSTGVLSYVAVHTLTRVFTPKAFRSYASKHTFKTGHRHFLRKSVWMNDVCVLYLDELSQLCVGGVMCNEESQTVISDLHWSRPVHFYTHKGLFIKNK